LLAVVVSTSAERSISTKSPPDRASQFVPLENQELL
jgi:hypothetical protein